MRLLAPVVPRVLNSARVELRVFANSPLRAIVGASRRAYT